jgi:RNA polymerase sigma-70 factor (ECF subfamily)
MNGSPDSLPSPKDQLALHQRLVEGDSTASSDLAGVFLDHLIDHLVQNNRKIPSDFCEQAAGDALIALFKNPRSFNPTRGRSLSAYLEMSAQGDLQNLLRQERRHHRRRQSLESVELSPQAGKYLGKEEDPSLPLQIEEEVESAKVQVLPAIGIGLTDGELRVLDLMLKGERRTSVFAQAYGISHLPKKEQKAEIKRVKDKLKNRLKRARPDHDQPS